MKHNSIILLWFFYSLTLFSQTPIYTLYNQAINLSTIGRDYHYDSNNDLVYDNSYSLDPSGSENKVGKIPNRVHRMYSGFQGSLNSISTNVAGHEKAEATEVTVSYSGPASNQTVYIKIGATSFSSNSSAWTGVSSYSISKAASGTNTLSLNASDLATISEWIRSGSTIYFGAVMNNEQSDGAYFIITNVTVKYKKRFEVVVTVDRDYDENSVVSLNGSPIVGTGGTLKFDELSTVNISASIQVNYNSQPHVFSSMSLSGLVITGTTFGFSISADKTLNLIFAPAYTVTLDNRVNYSANTSERIEGSSIIIKNNGANYSTATAGQAKYLPQNANMSFITNHGVNGENLNYKNQGYKIKHQNWNTSLLEYRIEKPQQITQDFTYNAWYHELRPASIAATLEGVSTTNVEIQLKDPWRYNGGGQPGNWDNYNTTTSNSLGLGNSGSVAGIFLGVPYNSALPNNAHYRIKGNPQVINGLQSNLTNWTATNALVYDGTKIESPIMFNASGGTITANYKASFASNNAAAITNSSQRKIARTSGPSTLHIVYESMGSIWYETSTDNGSTWNLMNNNQPISSGTGPSIVSIDNSASDADAVFIVYQASSAVKMQCFAKPANSNSFSYSFTQDISSYQDYVIPNNKANAVIAQTIVSGGSRYISIVWEGSKQVAFQLTKSLRYWHGSVVGGLWGVNYSPAQFLATGEISNSTTASANPTIAANVNGGNFQLAWQEGTSSIMYKTINQSLQQSTAVNVSSGNGFVNNYSPSIIATTSNTYPARLSWVGKRWIDEGEVELQKATAAGRWEYNTIFTDPSSVGSFWVFGSSVNSTNININQADNGYIIAWSKSDGVNEYTRNSSLGGNIWPFKSAGINIIGKDVQVVAGTSFSDMYGVTLNTGTAPYQFKRSDNITSLGKEANSGDLYNGREGIISRGDAQFYFMLGDITVDGTSISFDELSDTTKIDSKPLVNQYLTSQPFTLTDQSDFSFGVMYGFSDSTACQEALALGDVEYKVQLINDLTGAVIGEYDHVIFNQSNVFQYRNLGYQVNTKGIGNATVRLKLVVTTNLDAQYRVSSRHNNQSVTAAGKFHRKKGIQYQGSLIVKEYALEQNFPNPFNPSTSIGYAIPKAGSVTLKVYDILGKEIATLVNAYQEPGNYVVNFDASKLSTGLYVYKLRSDKFTEVKKMMLVK